MRASVAVIDSEEILDGLMLFTRGLPKTVAVSCVLRVADQGGSSQNFAGTLHGRAEAFDQTQCRNPLRLVRAMTVA